MVPETLRALAGTLLGTGWLLASPAMAERIAHEVKNVESMHDIDPKWDSDALHISYNGDIRAGDADTLEKILESKASAVERVRIHLNLSGGSYEEAVKIAALIWEEGVTTSIDAGAECFSACAVIFMSGRELGYEGPANVSRYLHVKGRLGFHAPFLPKPACNSPPCSFPAELVSGIYEAAMRHLSDLLLGSTTAKWPPSLVGEMLGKAPNELLYIDTVEHAGRWRIELFGGVSKAISKHDATIGCLNSYRWSDDDKLEEYPLETITKDYIDGWSRQVKQKNRTVRRLRSEPKQKLLVFTVPIDNLNALGCTIAAGKATTEVRLARDYDGVWGDEWPSWKFFHPATRIIDLERAESSHEPTIKPKRRK